MTVSKNILQPKKFKILLVGDSCIDEYIYGNCDRLNPEAPVPVLQITRTTSTKGMAANVKSNLESFGIDIYFYTGDALSIKRRFIDNRSKQHLIRVDDDRTSKLLDPSILKGHLVDAVVISDYCKGLLDYNNIKYICDTYDVPIFIDTKKTDLAQFSYDHVYVKINEPEFLACTSKPKNLIVTLGHKGAAFIHNGTKQYFACEKIDVVDVCGAGDTFLSAVAARYLNTKNIADAIVYANRAAGINVVHRGAYSLTKDDIESIEHARY